MRPWLAALIALTLIAASGAAEARARARHARAAVWDDTCPIPRDLPPLWAAGWSPVAGWRYPCHTMMTDFAPARCYRDLPNPGWWGQTEWHRVFICR